MAKKVSTEQSIKRARFNTALKLLFKYDKPTAVQICRHMCLGNNCPDEHCTFLLGFKNGEDCGHAIAVKRIIDNLIQFRDVD